MQPSRRLLQQSARVLLFTRPNCSLCDVAKRVLTELGSKRIFDYQEIDVLKKGQEDWKRLYQYDTPVVHVQRVVHTYAKPDTVTDIAKIFHQLGICPITF